jgi:L-amino acid N-acyltransferase YncA
MSMPPAVAEVLDRAHRGIRRFGVAGSIRRIASLMGHSLARAFYVRERHLWYALMLTAPLAQTVCPPGFTLAPAGVEDVALLEELPTIGAHEARERLAAGAELWLLREGTHGAFACWIFRGRTPVFAARDGWLSLPPGTVCLEDSVTSPAYRGRGLASAAWSEIARVLQGQHVAAMITKVAEDNAASRRAVEKAGFEPVAMMTLTRRGLRSRVEVQPYRRDGTTTFLEAALSRS